MIKKDVKQILTLLYQEHVDSTIEGQPRYGLTSFKLAWEYGMPIDRANHAIAFLLTKKAIKPRQGIIEGSTVYDITEDVGIDYFQSKRFIQELSIWRRIRFMDRTRAIKDIIVLIAAGLALVISLYTLTITSCNDQEGAIKCNKTHVTPIDKTTDNKK